MNAPDEQIQEAAEPPVVKTYSVELWLGTIYAEVEAVDEDEAISAALSEWEDSQVLENGTFSVRES